MKRTILYLILFLFSAGVRGTDYSKTDKQAMSVPQNLKTAGEITRYLTRNLTSPTDKARVIYYWIAHSIRYDVTKMYSNQTYTDPQELVDEALKFRKGICSNYAALFQACCRSAGVQSYIIEGYTRQNNKAVLIGHAWNAVRINNRFYEVDATWASGSLKGNRYIPQFKDEFFMIPPVEFIRTHMPFDPIWQFSTNPITPKEFEKGDFSRLSSVSTFNYYDSIKVQSGLSTLDKLARENQRILGSGVINALIRNHVANNQQGIATESYNKAADLFNKGVEKYNYYIACKNKQFSNMSMKDADILGLLSTSHQSIESAEKILSGIKSNNYNLSYQSETLEKSIVSLKKNLKEEDKFASKYVKTLKPLRIFLFYKKT